MSINELERPVPDTRTIPNYGRTLDDFEFEKKDPRQEYSRAREIRNLRLQEMREPYKQLEIDRANSYFKDLFSHTIEKFSLGNKTKIGSDMWLMRRVARMEGEEIKVIFAFIDINSDSQPRKIQINISGVGSYLEMSADEAVTSEVRITPEGEQIVSSPATIVDARVYRGIVNSIK